MRRLAIVKDPGPELASGREILLVGERDPALEHALLPLGRELVFARTPAEALGRLAREELALVVIAAAAAALELARSIRARRRGEATPILVVAERDADPQLARGYELGWFDVVDKLRPDVLRARATAFVELKEHAVALREGTGRAADHDVTRLLGVEQQRRQVAELAARRARFLADASALLASPVDWRETLRGIARLAVPGIADWAGIEVADEGGALVSLDLAEPVKRTTEDVRPRYPRRVTASWARSALASRTPQLHDLGVEIAGDETRLARVLGLQAALTIPVEIDRSSQAVITLLMAESERRFDHGDLALAEDLAARCRTAFASAQRDAGEARAIGRRDDMIAFTGHELHRPLAAVVVALESLAQLPDARPLALVKPRLGKLVAQTRKLSRIARQLRDLSPGESLAPQLEREQVELGDLVRAVAFRFTDLGRTDTPITIDVESVIGYWDRDGLEQVIATLIANAMKLGGRAPIDITVAHRGDRAAIVLSDRAIAIDASRSRRLFDRTAGGPSFELWAARVVVEAHGGTLTVDGACPGCTFTVLLPLRHHRVE